VTLAADLPRPRPFFRPDRISFDSQCLTIDGQDMFIYSGAFHYFRCPKELWADRFAKIKAAGFNTVETYIPWNLCEPQMPANLEDFSKVDLKDVDDWLTMAEQNGLYVIIRPGPYICAEFQRGGLPGWLEAKRPVIPKRPTWVRTDDDEFMAWSTHWYRAVCPMLAAHQITHKKLGERGIILFQLENEYDYSGFADNIKTAYMKSLGDEAINNGIDVPMISCWTRCVRGNPDTVLRHVFDSCNFYPGWNIDGTLRDITALRKAQPDAPLMTTELQGGWFTGTGPNDAPQLRPDSYNWRPDLIPAQINNLTLFVWQNGETITNYYMLFGGTNLADTAAKGISASYDYSAPIRENGGVDEKYFRVAALGEMIREHGTRLARATAVDCQTITDQKDVTVVERRAEDGSRFLFVRTSQHAEPRSGTAHLTETPSTQPAATQPTDAPAEITLQYELEPLGSKVLYLPPGITDASKGEWLPKTLPATTRPSDIPDSVKITEARYKADSGPENWKPIFTEQSLTSVGINDSRFVFYRLGGFQVSQDELDHADSAHLKATHDSADRVMALINGRRASLDEDLGAEIPAAAKLLRAGENQLLFLYENAGFANGGEEMLRFSGISRVRLALSGTPIKDWKMNLVDRAVRVERQPAIATEFADQDWQKIVIDKVEADQLKAKQTAVFRASLDLSQKDLDNGKTSLAVSRMDDRGTVFVNGKRIGQGDSWDRSYEFDASKVLQAGRNVIAIVVQNESGGGGLGTVELVATGAPDRRPSSQLTYSDEPAGVVGQWWKPDLDETDWKTQMLPEPASDAAALLSWHRMAFSLPGAKAGVWQPWLIRLKASGNGFIYLNGHAIGRYWEHGGQRDYYLPECWLNLGGGARNVITLALCPVEKGTNVESAEVIPYAAYAENREIP
jgi:hypothetical protein